MGDPLQIDLLGPFRIQGGEDSLEKLNRSPRLQELLAYLIIHREAPMQRQQMLLDFWPDDPEKQDLSNLRQLLYKLRNTLPDSEAFIHTTSSTIQWNSDAPCRIDLEEFETLTRHVKDPPAGRQVPEGNRDREQQIEALEKAVKIYRGPLLPHCFEEWIVGKRNRLQEQYAESLEQLTEMLERERKYQQAITYAEKLLEQDHCDEAAGRRLMRLHALNGDRALVVRTYQNLEERLSDELGIEPGSKTRELYRRLTSEQVADEEEPSGASDYLDNGSDEGWPLINRTEEWNKLLDAWSRARRPSLHCVMLRGEPGIGKSRLARQLLSHLTRQGYPGASAQCREAPPTPAYGPVADWLRSPSYSAGLADLDEIWQNEISRLLPDFTGQPVDDPSREPWQQQRFDEALARAATVSGKPGVLVLENIQWCDPETLGWIHYLHRRKESAPLLLVATLQPYDENERSGNALVSLSDHLQTSGSLHQLELGPLSREETLELASHILERRIGERMGRILFQETEGNPLFVVEMSREIEQLEELKKRDEQAFVAPDQTPSRIRTLPSGVSRVISRRLRYLSNEAIDVLAVGSVAGRQFSFDLISRCSDRAESEILNALEELTGHHILREEKAEHYDFTHDKLREIAYKELSDTRQRRLHLRVAGALKEIYSDDPANIYDRLAFHYDRAGEIGKAIEQYRKAADHARTVDNQQDAGMLRRALELLQSLPEDRERDRMELEITESLALSLLQRRDFDTGEAFNYCERAYKLSSDLGEPPSLVILYSLGMTTLKSGDPSTAHELGIVMKTLAGESEDPVAEIESGYLCGISDLIRGHIGASVEQFTNTLESFDDSMKLTRMHIHDLDGGIILKTDAALGYLIHGDDETARKLMEESAGNTQHSASPSAAAHHHFATARMEVLRDRPEQADEYIERFVSARLEMETSWAHQAAAMQGWCEAVQGYPERGIARMWEALKDLEDHQYLLHLPLYYCLLVTVLLEQLEIKEGLEALDQAQSWIDRFGGHYAQAELLRLRGLAMMHSDNIDKEKAQHLLDRALEKANEQENGLFGSRIEKSLKKFN